MIIQTKDALLITANTEAGPGALVVLHEPAQCGKCGRMAMMWITCREGNTYVSCAPRAAQRGTP